MPAFPHLRFERPTYITHVGDDSDRLFVLEQSGHVFWIDNAASARERHLSLDLRRQTRRVNNEEGMLGFAAHPDFSENGRVFLHYSAAPGRTRNHISEFRMDVATGVIDPGSERVLLSVDQPRGNHNGGTITFGPDGFLFIGLGDGGSAGDPFGNGQNLATLLGTILRIDVDHADAPLRYRVPADNPFVTDDGARGEIWAYGLRNPWRFSFDRDTGELWAGDVGQVESEEIDLIVKGGNYGWNYREGTRRFRRNWRVAGPFIDPVIEHGRGEARSITGGYVYRGQSIPTLRGWYVYGDYATGLMWALRYEDERVTGHRFIAHVPEIASFGEDQSGELYVVSLTGLIYKLTPNDRPAD